MQKKCNGLRQFIANSCYQWQRDLNLNDYVLVDSQFLTWGYFAEIHGLERNQCGASETWWRFAVLPLRLITAAFVEL